MQQMFGYDPQVSWKVVDIKPSRAEGLAELTVLVSNPQGQQSNKLYITSDGQHAVIGELIPFGVIPSTPRERNSLRKATGLHVARRMRQ